MEGRIWVWFFSFLQQLTVFFLLHNFWSEKKSLLTLYRYDFLCFLLNINSLAHIKMEVSATLTCYSLAAVKRHHGSHLSSDNESMKSFRKIMHYMVHESSVPLHRDTDDASSKKT